VLRVVPRRWLRILAPAIALAAVVGLDLHNGREPVLGLVVIAPLFGANIGPRLTAVYSVAALVCAALLGVHDEQYSSPETTSAQLTRLALIAAGGVLAVAASSARQRRDPQDVGQPGLCPTYRTGSGCARQGTGGRAPRLGHARGVSRAGARRADLCTLARDLDRAVQRVAEPEDFVTAALAQLGDDCCLSVVNAGHPPLLLVRDGVTVPLLPSEPRPPLGLDGAPLRLTLQLRPKDRLLLYTDGMTEARRPGDGAFFPVEQVLAPSLGTGSLPDGLTAVRSALLEWTQGGLADDVALLAVEVRADASAGGRAQPAQAPGSKSAGSSQPR
jgi:phosphoserine phosphatase RsbU/P